MIVSFYSYKGGVGRSQLCANIAAYLCYKKGKKVLLWDWDFEAPGLHYYFNKSNADINKPGTLEMLENYCAKMRTSKSSNPDENTDYIPDDSFINLVSSNNANQTGKIDLLACGDYTGDFSSRVFTFNWFEFYEMLNGKYYIENLKKWIKSNLEYDFIIIDSRTGLNEYSGICNLQLPDTNVIVMAANEQNFAGCKKISDKIRNAEYTKQGLRKPYVIPILSRINVSSSPYYQLWIDKFAGDFSDLLVTLDNEVDASFAKELFADVFLPKTILADDPIFSAGENILFTNDESQSFPNGSLIYKYASIGDYICNLKFNEKNNIGLLAEVDKKTWLGYAEKYIILKENEKAAIAFKRAGEFKNAVEYSEDRKLIGEILQIQIEKKDFQNSLITLKKVFDFESDNLIGFYYDTIIHWNLNKFKETKAACLKYFERIKSCNTEDFVRHFGQNYAEKLEIFNDNIKFYLGDSYFALEEWENIIVIFLPNIPKSFKDKTLSYMYYMIGTAYINIKNYEQALKYCNESYKINEHSYNTVYNIATTYVGLSDNENAIKFFKKAISIDTLNSFAYLGLFGIYIQRNDLANAEEIINKGLSKLPDNKELLNASARLSFSKKDFENAINNYKNILLSDSNNIDANIGLGFCLLYEQQFEESKKYTLKAFELGDKRNSLLNLGTLYWLQEDKKIALGYYSEAYRNFESNESFSKILIEDMKLFFPNNYTSIVDEINHNLKGTIPDIIYSKEKRS